MKTFLYKSKLEGIYFGVFIKEFEDFIVNVDVLALKWSEKVKTLLIHSTPKTEQIIEEYKELVEKYLQKNSDKKFLSNMIEILYPSLDFLMLFGPEEIGLINKIAKFNYNLYDSYWLNRFGEEKLPNPDDFHVEFYIEDEIMALRENKLISKKIDINKLFTHKVLLEVKDKEVYLTVKDDELLNITKNELLEHFKSYEPWKYEY